MRLAPELEPGWLGPGVAIAGPRLLLGGGSVQRRRPLDEALDERAHMRGQKLALRIDDRDVVLGFDDARQDVNQGSAVE